MNWLENCKAYCLSDEGPKPRAGLFEAAFGGFDEALHDTVEHPWRTTAKIGATLAVGFALGRYGSATGLGGHLARAAGASFAVGFGSELLVNGAKIIEAGSEGTNSYYAREQMRSVGRFAFDSLLLTSFGAAGSYAGSYASSYAGARSKCKATQPKEFEYKLETLESPSFKTEHHMMPALERIPSPEQVELYDRRVFAQRRPVEPPQGTKYSGAELASILEPRFKLSDYSFSRVSDLSAVRSAGRSIPPTRGESGYFKGNEDYWMAEMSRRIATGDVAPGTLVVADTGHGLTLAYEMTRQLGSQVYYHLPTRGLDPPSLQRLQAQAQSFGPSIAEHVGKSTAEHPTGILILDTHSNLAAPVSLLPNAGELLRAGYRRVLHASESLPSEFGAQKYSEGSRLHKWLETLKTDGRVEVLTDGFDIRPRCRGEFGQIVQPDWLNDFGRNFNIAVLTDTKMIGTLIRGPRIDS